MYINRLNFTSLILIYTNNPSICSQSGRCQILKYNTTYESKSYPPLFYRWLY